MEILIPGLILVALMVYASTRIKRSAAKAYEQETVETDDFVIQKPEGFLNVIGGDPKYVFEAYSKDFGGETAPEFRKATATVTVSDAEDDVRAGDRIISEVNEKTGGYTYKLTEAERTEKDVDLRLFKKSAVKDGRLHSLEIVALNETTGEFTRNIELMLQSFELK